MLYIHISFLRSLKMYVSIKVRRALAAWLKVRIVYSNWSGDREQRTVNVWMQNEVFMKNAATLSSILKKHYTHSRRKVEMLTFMLWSIQTLIQSCTHVRAHAHTARKQRKTDTPRRVVFLLSHTAHLNSGDVISNNYRWPRCVPCGCCWRAGIDNSRSQWRACSWRKREC